MSPWDMLGRNILPSQCFDVSPFRGINHSSLHFLQQGRGCGEEQVIKQSFRKGMNSWV